MHFLKYNQSHSKKKKKNNSFLNTLYAISSLIISRLPPKVMQPVTGVFCIIHPISFLNT